MNGKLTDQNELVSAATLRWDHCSLALELTRDPMCEMTKALLDAGPAGLHKRFKDLFAPHPVQVRVGVEWRA